MEMRRNKKKGKGKERREETGKRGESATTQREAPAPIIRAPSADELEAQLKVENGNEGAEEEADNVAQHPECGLAE